MAFNLPCQFVVRGLERVTIAARILSGCAMACLVLFSVTAVMSRYLLNKPIEGSSQIIGILVGISVFAALICVNRDQSHISVDLFEDSLSVRFRALGGIVLVVIQIIGFAIMTKLFIDQAAYFTSGGYTYDFAHLSKAWVFYFLSCLVALGACVLLLPLGEMIMNDHSPQSGTV